MLSIMWGIVKIIGILLLVVLGLCLAVLLLILFVPLCYEFSASGEYEKEDETEAGAPPAFLVKARVSWLLRFVCVRVRADGNGWKGKGKLFGVPVIRMGEEPAGEREQRKKKREKKRKKTVQEEAGGWKALETETPKPKGVKEKRIESKALETGGKKTEASGEKSWETEGLKPASLGEDTGKGQSDRVKALAEEESFGEEKAGEKSPKGSFLKRVVRKILELGLSVFRLFGKIKEMFHGIFQNLSCTFEKICAKIKGIFRMAEEIRDFLSAEENRETFRYVKGEAGKLIRHILPRKISGRVVFGLEDPSVVGKVLALLGVFYPLIGKRLTITPLFENRLYLEGSIFLKGRIRVFSLLIIVVRVWFSKKFRGLMKRSRELREQLSRA